MAEIARKGVSVIIMGGNVGLVVMKNTRGNYVLEPVKLPEIRKFVLGDADGTTLTLQEGSLAGEKIPVHFTDLRKTRLTYSDPEELDSAQINPELWAKLADTVHADHMRYEGFVILHGLDTMAYTASGLAFMLRNLQVPVILTGSQRPLNYPRTDAVQNIFSAITLAASESLGIAPVVPEVCIYSYDTLYRGSRVCMVDASSYRAFDSPNFPPLATVGEHIDIQQHLIPGRSGSQMNLRKSVSDRVTILDVFPGMNARILHSLAGADDGRGVLLRTYGMGTAPTSKEVLKALDSLTKAGKVVMNVTQARSGRISTNEDPVSLRLFEQGVISGVDMTSEAAYAKMVVLLSEYPDSEMVADMLQIAECGEQSISVFNIHYQPGQTTGSQASVNCFARLKKSKSVVGEHLLNAENFKNIKYIQLRMLGVEPVVKEEGTTPNRTIDFEALLADPAAEESAGMYSMNTDTLRWSSQTRPTINIAYDITKHKNRLISPNDIPSTILVLETNEPIKWKHLSILIYVSGIGEGKN